MLPRVLPRAGAKRTLQQAASASSSCMQPTTSTCSSSSSSAAAALSTRAAIGASTTLPTVGRALRSHPAAACAGASMAGHGASRGLCSMRLMTSSSAASSNSNSDDGSSGGFWEGPLASAASGAAIGGLLPQRQVPDHVLRFTTVAYMDSAAYIPFPHKDGVDARAFPTNPANFKVTLKVYLKDLGLTEREEKRLRCLVGARYNSGRGEVTLTSARFMNRNHNKQYLVYLLENLVAEAKREGAGAPAAASAAAAAAAAGV